KVHVEAKKFAAEGYTIVLIGHEGHEEVEGTMGEAPDHFVLIETEEDVDRLEVEDPERVAYLTQTTLSVDETARIIRRLRARSHPRSWCSGCWSSSAPAAPSTCRSSKSSRRTSASCCRARSARRSPSASCRSRRRAPDRARRKLARTVAWPGRCRSIVPPVG